VAITTLCLLLIDGNYQKDKNEDAQKTYLMLAISIIYSIQGLFTSFYLYGRKIDHLIKKYEEEGIKDAWEERSSERVIENGRNSISIGRLSEVSITEEL